MSLDKDKIATEYTSITTKNEQEQKDNMGRPLKYIKYEKEKKEVLNKLLKILGIDDNNKVFFKKDIADNKEKEQQILDLIEDIKKYFNYSRWSYFLKSRPYTDLASLVKCVLRDMNIEIVSFVKYPKGQPIKRGFRLIN